VAILALVVGLVLACAPSGQQASPATAPAQSSRTLNTLMQVEPGTLLSKQFQRGGIPTRHAARLFNAELDLQDARGNTHPYLAEALPQLHTDTWRVLPDGRMETSYRLKPNLVWHDGHPLSAEDFVFGWRVYTDPQLAVPNEAPQSLMEEVLAPDARTIVFRWRRLYPDANALGRDFQALPRHILESVHAQSTPDAFLNHQFWTTEYVGLGPYRLHQWELGALLEGVAFDGHVLGRPKIERIIVRYIGDVNTALANLVSGSVDFASDRALQFEQGYLLKQDWVSSKQGVVISTPIQTRFTHVQLRPDLVNPRALLDLRVRKALAHSIDRAALNEGLFYGEGVMSDTYIVPYVPYFADVERAITRYPYDVRRTEQFMQEAGFSKGADSTFVSAAGERFNPQLMGLSTGLQQKELAIMTDTWQRAGIDIQPRVLPLAQMRDGQVRSTFPALYTAGNGAEEKTLGQWSTSGIGSPENRWVGGNRGGWSNPEYDRLWEAFNTTLDRTERNQQVVQMMKVLSDEVGVLILFNSIDVTAHAAALQGPHPMAIDDLVNWNVHEWEFR
jgi:peptide/nickel transport system substrate-binding protein